MIRFSGERVNAKSASVLTLALLTLTLALVGASPGQAKPARGMATTSQGVAVTSADDWHSAGQRGAGVKVAVLERGFQGYASLIASGELPSSAITHSFRSDGDLEAGEVRGAACAEIVHDMAPDAQLYLVNFSSDAEFGAAVDWIISQGVRVVSCSANWPGAGPGDGTGPLCDAVNHALDSDIFWAQSAGDAAQRHWEGPWSDPDGDNLHNFSAGDEDQAISVAANARIEAYLIWDDPWNASANDYDLFLRDPAGQVVASSTQRQSGVGCPSETITYDVGPAGAYHLAIQRVSASAVSRLELYVPTQGLEHVVSTSSLLIPADARGAVATGATAWSTDALEGFSSRGPTTDARGKPEFTAPDRVSSAAYGAAFVSTAAATAHVAGAATLVRAAYPAFGVTETLTYLQWRAVDLGNAGFDNEYGYGRLSLGAPPPPSPPTPTQTATQAGTATEITVTLQQGADGYSGAEDIHIYQYDPDNIDDYYWQPQLKVGDKQRYAALLRFDLTGIPADATVTRATVQLYAAGWSGYNLPFAAYCVTRTTSLLQTTWNQAQAGNPWGLPGANNTSTDRRASPESALTTSGIAKWYAWDLTSVTQGWVNGSLPNNGVLLRCTSTGPGSFNWASAQDGDVTRRPRLVITYRTGSGPANTPTPTRTATPTATTAVSPTPTHTATQSPTPTQTPGGASTFTPTPTSTHSATPSPTPTTGGAEVSVTLQQGVDGYSGAEDIHIYQYDPDNIDDYYWQPQLKVGDKQRYAALLRFDLTGIPADATVTRATLQLYATGWSGYNLPFAAYCVTRTTTLLQTTWNQAQAGNPWGLPGANNTSTDRRASPESALTTSGIAKWYAWDLTSVTQGWVNGSLPNNGVLLRCTSTGPGSFYWASAQDGNATSRPRLVINYRTSGGPANTPTPTRTATPTATSVSGSTPTHTPTFTLTVTPVAPSTPTPTATPTRTATASPTATTTGGEVSVTVQRGTNGYYGAEDTYLYQYDPNNCDDYWWQIQNKVGDKQRNAILLRFDVSSIPADATLSRATVQLYAAGWSGSNLTLSTHYITRTVNLYEATWNQAEVGSLWSVPGCNSTLLDRRAAAESTVSTSGIGKWYAWDLTGVAQGWVDGNLPNNGILLRSTYIASPWFSFSGAQEANVGLRPKLTITYRLGGPTPTPEGSPTPGLAPLVIGHITDAHMLDHWAPTDRLPQAIQRINQEAQILVDSGDCTNDGTAVQSAAYASMMNSTATVPWRAVQGNHDTPARFEMYIGPLSWTWDAEGYRLIGINTESIDYAALDQSLTADKPCIIVGHFPLSYCNPGDQVLLRQRLVQYHVPLYIAGHTHLDSSGVDAETGTLVVTGQPGYMGHYRLITLHGYATPGVTFISTY